ncbi:MAG TPA: 2-oxo acid dehydrogenase subunit E2 [Anaerolineae bacterium]|nr:2-oxo acid dehydrogenase subunit E2 [Anaerolineae bacterium]
MADVIRMPKLGFDMAEGTLVRWVIGEGETIAKGEVIAEIETDKATVEVEAQTSGILHKHLVQEGTLVPIGTPIAILGEAGETIDVDALVSSALEAEPSPADDAAPASAPAAAPTVVEPAALAPEPAPVEIEGRLPGGVKASPVARCMATEHGLDLARIRGTGPGGRIVKRDIEAALQTAPTLPMAAAMVTPSKRESIREPLSKLRAIIGKRMTAAKQQVPHFYVTVEMDAAPLLDLRRQFNALLPEEEKLSVNDFIVKAAALNLQRFPALNASLDGDHILRHGQVNIGVAVAMDDGLMTIVIHDADLKPLRQIGSESRTMIERARSGRVRSEDIEGSTFTVSNMGMFDVDHFIAIVNPPEAAILAVGSVRQVPVVEEGKITIGQRMKVTLSADHRVTDGAEVARWLQSFVQILEQPLQLALL